MRHAAAKRAALAALLLGLLSGAAPAEAPAWSPRPEPRPEPAAAPARAPERSPRPLPRADPRPVQAALLPPPKLVAVAPTTATTPPQIHPDGLLCGDPGLTGVPLMPIEGAAEGCGLSEPVRITAVSGVDLSRPIAIDCSTARALRDWVDRGVKPAIATLGGGLDRLEVAAAYVCRPRNNLAGGRVSEHGRGGAVDVFGFTLASGATLTVAERWRPIATSALFREVHEAACGPFSTVLGPDADAYHRDHLHLDTQLRRGDAYCR